MSRVLLNAALIIGITVCIAGWWFGGGFILLMVAAALCVCGALYG